MAKSTPQSTRLEIFGGVYTVRGDHDAERLEELAAKVDGDMRKIAKQLSTVDPTRIAILAALNIADELFQCRQRIDGDRTQMTERLVQLSDQLAGALES